MNRSKRFDINNLIGWILIFSGVGVLIFSSRFVLGEDIWFDELFTVSLAQMPLRQMLPLAAKDVHPPLFYILTRMIWLVSKLFAANVSICTAAKLTAIIPYYLLTIYSIIFVRRRFGTISAGLTILFVQLMPALSQYLVEARMYSVAMFVIMAMLIHGMEAMRYATDETEAKDKKIYIHLIATLIYGVMAMYLHYYALICAGVIVIGLLIYILINHIRKPGVAPIAIFAIIGLIAYIPWIQSMLSQVGAVSASYWIQPLTFRSIGGCIKFIFKPEFENGIISYAVAFLLIVIMAFATIIYIINCRVAIKQNSVCTGEKNTDNRCEKDYAIWRCFFIIFCIMIPVLLVVAGFVASVLIRPVFVYRYMIPALGVFWMGMAITVGKLIESAIQNITHYRTGLFKMPCEIIAISLVCIFFITSFFTFRRDYQLFMWEENKKSAGMKISEQAFEEIKTSYSDRYLVCNFNQVQAVLWNYLDNPSVLWGETTETLIADICNRTPIIMTEDTDELRKLTDDEFIYIGTGNIREEIIESWKLSGARVDELFDSCLVERYYFNVYNVSWQ